TNHPAAPSNATSRTITATKDNFEREPDRFGESVASILMFQLPRRNPPKHLLARRTSDARRVRNRRRACGFNRGAAPFRDGLHQVVQADRGNRADGDSAERDIPELEFEV